MTAAWRSTGTPASGTGAVTPTLPAGWQVGDIFLCVVETENQNAGGVPTGTYGTWAEVTNSPQGCGTAGSAGATGLRVYWSRAVTSHSNPTVPDSGVYTWANVYAYSGCITTGNPWDVTNGGTEAVSDTSGSAPGVTTTADGELVVVIATNAVDGTAAQYSGNFTNSNLTGIPSSPRQNTNWQTQNGGGVGVTDGTKSTAGATGNTTWTQASASYKCFLTIALKNPAPVVNGAANIGVSVGITAAGVPIRQGRANLATSVGLSVAGSATHYAGVSLSTTVSITARVTEGTSWIGGQSANNGTSSNATVAPTLPSGWQAGDLLFVALRVGTSGLTFTQTAGTGTWDVSQQASYPTGGYTWLVAFRVMQAGDTAPTFGWVTAGKYAYSTGGFRPRQGETLSIDTWATVAQPAAGNSVTPNAATAAGTGEMSAVFTFARAQGAAATTWHSYSPPAGYSWGDGDAAFQSTATLNARFAAIAYLPGQSGTVTPGSESLIDSADDHFYFTVLHVLVSAASGAVNGAANVGISVGLSVGGTKTAVAGVNLATSVSLSVAGVTTHAGAATLHVTQSITAAGAKVQLGAAALHVTQSITAAGVPTRPGAATLHITASMTAAAGKVGYGHANLATTVSVATAAFKARMSHANLAVTVTLGAAGTPLRVGRANLSISVALSATGKLTRMAGVNLSITAALTSSLAKQGAANLHVSVAISSAGYRGRFGAATLGSSVSISVVAKTTHFAVSSLSTGVTLGVQATRAVLGATAMHLTTGIAAAGYRLAQAAAQLLVRVLLTAVGRAIPPGVLPVEAYARVSGDELTISVADDAVSTRVQSDEIFAEVTYD